MIKGIKVQLKPNNKQNSKMFQSAGTARWAYNFALAKQEENYALKGTSKCGGKFISDNDLRKELTILKKTEEFKWLNNYSNNITKQAIKDCCDAYIRFFNKLSDKPNFKSRKKSKPSFYQDTYKIKFTRTHVRLEKIGWVKLTEYNRIPIDTKYYNPRVSYDGVHWYVSVGIEISQIPIELTNDSVGIDLGVKVLAVCSNKEEPYKNINKTKTVKRLEKKLKRLKRKVSKKYEKNKEGRSYIKTKNIIKLEKNIKKIHKRLDNIRIDNRHKVTTEIVKNKPSRIVMESLNISGMLKNRHLSKAVAEQGLYKFKETLKYKAKIYGIEFVEADKWYPSSKTCSECGYVKPKLSLSERTFVCECCKTVIDRDKNASINLSRYVPIVA